MSDDRNPFLDLAELQISAPVKARQRAAEKRAARKTAVDKALDERDAQVRAWRAWRRERTKALLSGPHGQAAAELARFLETMSLGDGAALIAFVEAGPWRDADNDTRFEVLAMVDRAIMRLRENHGLPPFDDALPFSDEPPTAFQSIRGRLQ